MSTEQPKSPDVSNLTQGHKMESLSRAYIQAVAGQAGLNVRIAPKAEFDYGVDGTFQFVKSYQNKLVESGHPIDFQVKATTNWRINNNEITYAMEVAAYNKIADRSSDNTAIPMILLLFCMPEKPEDWIAQDGEQLLLRKCCYWYRITGELSDNTSSVTIRIPISQILTPTAIVELLQQVRRREMV